MPAAHLYRRLADRESFSDCYVRTYTAALKTVVRYNDTDDRGSGAPALLGPGSNRGPRIELYVNSSFL